MPAEFKAEIKGQEILDEAVGAVLMDIWFKPDEIILYFTRTPQVRDSSFRISLKIERETKQPFSKIKVSQFKTFPLQIPPKVIDHFRQFECYIDE